VVPSHRRLQRNGLAAGLAEALTAIHAAGVIHRDLKPGNALLTQSGPKVDFGIAQAMDSHEAPDITAVPAGLRPLVAAALAKNPKERPAALDLLRQLTGAAGQLDDPADMATQALLSRTWLLPARDTLASAPQHATAGAPGSVRPPAAGPPPPSTSSAPPPSATAPAATTLAPGTVETGTQDCTFNTTDGGELASAAVTDTVCKDWPAAQASDGEYWWPVDYRPPDAVLVGGVTEVCALSTDGMTMTIYDLPTNAPQQTPPG
jgi:hypothetical protein